MTGITRSRPGPTPPALPPTIAAGWHPDPLWRHELRYFDGSTWTDYVCNQRVQTVDPV